MAEIFSQDIFFDIFSRLPIEPLLQLKCVCKEWPDMIDDPCLANMHLARAAAAKFHGAILLIDHPTKKKPLKSTRKPDSTLFRLLKEDECSKHSNFKTNLVADFVISPSASGESIFRSSCQGLLCFSGKSCVDGSVGDVVIICNPLRKEAIMLPPLTMPALKLSYGLGFDSTTNTYKIVHTYFEERVGDHPYGEGHILVHTLGTNSWRKVSGKPPCPLLTKPVFAHGALHWRPHSRIADHHREEFISFDMGKEVFYYTACPHFEVYDLVDLGGFLAMVDLSSNMCVEIWLLKGDSCYGGSKEWVKEYRIQMRAPCGSPDNRRVEVVGMWENDEILLRTKCELIFSYNPKTDGLRCMYIPGKTSDTEMIGFRGSLVSPSRLIMA